MNQQAIYQKALFDSIIDKLGGKKQIVHDLQSLLFIKKGAAYKRINGETALTLEETIVIAKHFKISLDSVFQSEKYTSFFHPFVKENRSSPDIFLTQFNKLIYPLKDGEPGGRQLYYLSNEIPVFYYFGHKYIFNFLMTVWGHLHWDNHRMEIGESVNYDQQADQLRADILNNYYSNRVTEIWNSNMMNNLYQQIIFCITIRAFKEANYLDRLINDIQNLLIHLRTISVEGTKSIKGAQVEGSELKIYLNDFGNYSNMVLFESEDIKNTFIGFDFPQFIMSDNKAFFNYSKNWIEKILSRSLLISTEGFQYRELFFIKMEKDFSAFKEKAEKLMQVYYG